MDVIELNEAFAAQGLAVMRQLGLADDDAACEPQWRRDRARPPARHVRRAPGPHRDRGTAPHRRPLRALHDVHRRRAGHRDGDRAGLRRLPSPTGPPSDAASRWPRHTRVVGVIEGAVAVDPGRKRWAAGAWDWAGAAGRWWTPWQSTASPTRSAIDCEGLAARSLDRRSDPRSRAGREVDLAVAIASWQRRIARESRSECRRLAAR